MANESFTREDIKQAWESPRFNSLPEDDRIAIMSDMDPEFARFPAIDRRRVVQRFAQQLKAGRPNSMARPASEDMAAAVSLTNPQLDAPTFGGIAQPPMPPPPPAASRNPMRRSSDLASVPQDPYAATPAAGPSPFTVNSLPQDSTPAAAGTQQQQNPLEIEAARMGIIPHSDRTMLPAAKPTGVIRNIARPGPHVTLLPQNEELEFRKWVATNRVPFDPGPQSDYDMRGYWKALRARDQRVAGSDPLNPPAEFQTPYHPEFSNKSIFAGADAPKWMQDKLVDSFGRVIKDKAVEKAAGKMLAQKSVESVAKRSPKQPFVFSKTGEINGMGDPEMVPQYQPPVELPLAGIVPGTEKLGGRAPGVPLEKIPEFAPTFQELQRQPGAENPNLFFDPMTGTSEPAAGSTPAEIAQFGMNDPSNIFIKQALAGVSGLAIDAPGGIVSMVGNATGSDVLSGTGQSLTDSANVISESMAPPPDLPSAFRDGWGEALSDPRWWAASMGNGIGSMLPMMATGVGSAAVIEKAIASGIIRGPMAQMLVKYGPAGFAGVQEGILSGGNAYNEAKQAGATEEQAREVFAKVAATTALTAVPSFAAGAMNSRLGPIARTAAGVPAEAGQEVLQGRGEDWAKRVYDPNAPIGSQDLENAVGGAFGGAVAAPMEYGAAREEQRRRVSPSMQQEFEGLDREMRGGQPNPPPPGAPPPAPPASNQQTPQAAPPAAPTPNPASTPPQQAEAAPQAPPPPPKKKNPMARPAAPGAPTIEEIPADIEEMLAAEEDGSETPPGQYQTAVEMAKRKGKISPRDLQNELVIGFAEAEELAARLEKDGIVGPIESNGVRWLREEDEEAPAPAPAAPVDKQPLTTPQPANTPEIPDSSPTQEAKPIASEAKNDAEEEAKPSADYDYRLGDVVRWVNKKGVEVRGTVENIDPEGYLTVRHEGSANASGVPIRGTTTLPQSNVELFSRPESTASIPSSNAPEMPAGVKSSAPGPGEEVVQPAPVEAAAPVEEETGSKADDTEDIKPFKGARKLVQKLRVRVLSIGISNTPALNAFIKEQSGLSVGSDIDQKAAYDALETAVNMAIADSPQIKDPSLPAETVIAKLKGWMKNMPTQTTRTEGQVASQQFSTPPPHAYVAVRVAGVKPGSVMMESSAGNGGIAAFGKAAGATVVANEIDPTRRGFLEMQGYRVFGENAEQIHNILPADVQPDTVVMNPPFSASSVRGVANSNTIGYQHVIQAMKRLKPGGRLVAILGTGAKMGNPNARNFWKQMQGMGVARADVGISGKEYTKYGTSFDNRIVVFDKFPSGVIAALGETPVKGEYNTVEEAWNALSGIPERYDAGNGGRAGTGDVSPGSQPQASGDGQDAGSPGLAGGLQRPATGDKPAVQGQGESPQSTGGNLGSKPAVSPQERPEGAQGSDRLGSGDIRTDSPAGLTEEEARNEALKKLAEEADADIAAGEQALKDLGFYTSLGSTNLDPRALAPLVKIGLGYAKKGYVSFKRWSDAMVKQFEAVADKIRPHLRDIYDQAMEQYEAAIEDLTRTFQKPTGPVIAPEEKQPTSDTAPATSPTTAPEAAPASPAVENPADPASSTPKAKAKEVVDEPEAAKIEDDGDFTVYVAKIPSEWGAQPHKAKIVETQSMAGVQTRPVTVKPNVPDELIRSGALSDIQMVSISRAAEAFQQVMPDGSRIGYFIGDGTGVGKGRQIAGTILHLWNSGVKQIVWISYNETLLNDAKRDLEGLKMSIPIRWLGDFKLGTKIGDKMPQGIVFGGYATLASMAAEDKQRTDTGFVPFRRVRQILDWAKGEVGIIFDEAHKAKNAGTSNASGRGTRQGTNSGRAVLALQRERPGAHVLYSSATGFTEPENLVYAPRLGLWGDGTSFKDFGSFRQAIERGGMGAMEMIARDLKAQGRYESRFISYGPDRNGIPVEFDEVEHPLSPEQKDLINKSSEAWRIVSKEIVKAFAATETPNLRRGQVTSQFYGALLRFNMTVLTAMKVPTLIKEIDASHARGERVIISVLLTGEAAQERELEKKREEDFSLDDLDLSPARTLQELVERSFPTQQYETVVDSEGNESSVPVFDSEGNAVHNDDMVAKKNALLARLSDLRLPDSAIDQIINRYGANKVAELTGRHRRVQINPKTGQREVVDRKGDDLIKRESDEFQDGEKNIAIISPASSTGISLHASNDAKNKERRRHIILQLMWSADQQMQVFGRSHRTNQSVPPHYTLLTMNVGGEKRFASAIARRLEQLGALSRGDRGSSGAGSIANYNFETEYGASAANELLSDMIEGDERLLGGIETVRMMGFDNLMEGVQESEEEDEAENNSPRNRLEGSDVAVKQFFNRIQLLPISLQNQVFEEFVHRMQRRIDDAKRDGTYDHGAEKLEADKIEEAHPPVVIRTDEATGAQTFWYQLDAKNKRKQLGWDYVKKSLAIGYKLIKSPTGILGLLNPRTRSTTDETTGAISNKYEITRANGEVQLLTQEERNKWAGIEDAEAEPIWEKQLADAGEFRTTRVNLIGGSVLPVYSSFGSLPKVKIANLSDGSRIVGVEIGNGAIRQVLREIGYGTKVNLDEIHSRLAENENSYSLAGGMVLSRTTIQGEHAIQLLNVTAAEGNRLAALGVKNVLVNFRPKYFIPLASQDSKETLGKLLKAFPPVADKGGSLEFSDEPDYPSIRRPVTRGGDQAGFMAPDFLPTIFGGLAGRIRGNPTQKQTQDYHQFPEENEKAFQAAGKAQDEPKGIMDTLKEAYGDFKALGRVYRHLSRANFGPVINKMVKLHKAQGIASSRAMISMSKLVHQTGKMTKPEYELLRKSVIVDDLMETVELFAEKGEALADDHKLAFNFTPATLREEQAKLKTAIADNEAVSAALEYRRAIWAEIKDEYLEAMKSAGEDVTGKLQRKDYYRHQVLLQKRLEALASSGKLAAPNQRSFLQARDRENVGLDYQTNFVETEMKVMTQLMIDTQTAQFVAWLDGKHNIIRDLKEQAKWKNVATVMPYFEVMAADANANRGPQDDSEPLTGNDMFRRVLNRQQAIAMDELGKLAVNDQLPDTPDGKWAETIAALADRHLAKKAAEDEESFHGDTEAGDVIGYAAWLLRQPEASKASRAAGSLFKGIQSKKAAIKRIAGDKFVTWEDLVPETHKSYQMDPKKAYYSVFTIPEHLALKALEDQAETIGLKAEDIRKVFARGADKDPMILPAEIVKQFEEMQATMAARRAQDNLLVKGSQAIMGAWKRYQIISPLRAVKYTLRNQSGDLDAIIAGVPWITSAKMAKDLLTKHQREVAAYFKPILTGEIHKAELSPGLKTFASFGAFEGLLAVQEIGDPIVPDVLQEFSRWEKGEPEPSVLQRRGPVAAYRGWMRKAEVINNWREAANRYAVYQIFLADIAKNNGSPSSYSASLREEVDALETNEEKAYRMSNDLLGAYDEVSRVGQWTRKNLIPFWSYQELNFKRYARLIRNSTREGMTKELVGRMAVGAAARAPYMAYRVASTGVKMYALWALWTMLNGLFAGDDDDKLRKDIRLRPHLTFGSTPDGTEVIYFPRIGNISDILEILDLDEMQDSVKAAWEGRKGWDRAAWDILRSGPLEKLFNSLGPYIKYPIEAIFDKMFYPNIDRPRAIESWPEKIAQDLGLGDAFRGLTGRPNRQLNPMQRAADLVIYRADPKESGYYDTLDMKQSWRREQGLPDDGFSSNKPTTEALRNVKKALRYRDQAAFNTYLQKYVELGGDEKGFNASIKRMAPLAGLNKEQQARFIESLSAEDKSRLDLALQYYDEVFTGDTADKYFREYAPK